MTFFVDANVVLYSAIECEQRASCLEVLEAVVRGADGRTSPAVLEEVWHIERSGRLGDLSGLTEHAHRIFSPLVSVTDEAFTLAMSVHAGSLGANDRVHVGTCLAHEIGTIVTADQGFDTTRVVRRVDPADAAAVRRLISRPSRRGA